MTAAHESLGTVRPLHRIHVLVGSRDPVFLNTATLLFRRRGFRVEAVRLPADVVALVAESEPDIVVLDATGSVGWAALATSRMLAVAPRVAFVMVAEGLDEATRRRLGILEKAESLEGLGAHVERAYLRLPR